MHFYPIRKGQARVQVQAVKWVALQQICQTLMNSMMISKRVNANAPTLERSPHFASTFVSDLMVMLNALTVTTFLTCSDWSHASTSAAPRCAHQRLFVCTCYYWWGMFEYLSRATWKQREGLRMVSGVARSHNSCRWLYCTLHVYGQSTSCTVLYTHCLLPSYL